MKHIEVESAGITDAGLVRTDNQDHFVVVDLTRSMLVRSSSLAVQPGSRLFGGPVGQLYLVADGMGGHRAGSEASKLAIQYFLSSILNSMSWLARIEPTDDASFAEGLKTMLFGAHRELQFQSHTQDALEGMGTTLTMAYVAWPKMYIVHAGDTRCYLLRDGLMRLITRDHTVANQMMQAGRLDPSSVERSPWSNVLINALGAGAEDIFADIYRVDLQPGDAILLCSDGLNKHADDATIRKIWMEHTTPKSICEHLMRHALHDGGTDNVTVIVSQFHKPEDLNPQMQIIATTPNEERVIHEFAISAEDIDTSDDSEGVSTSPTLTYPGDTQSLPGTTP